VISWGSSHLLNLFGYGLCTQAFPFSDCCKGLFSLLFFFFSCYDNFGRLKGGRMSIKVADFLYRR
jgi:hypothetical protein